MQAGPEDSPKTSASPKMIDPITGRILPLFSFPVRDASISRSKAGEIPLRGDILSRGMGTETCEKMNSLAHRRRGVAV